MITNYHRAAARELIVQIALSYVFENLLSQQDASVLLWGVFCVCVGGGGGGGGGGGWQGGWSACRGARKSP